MNSKILVPNNEHDLLKKEFLLEKSIENIANSNKVALTELYEATKSSVYGFALSILKNSSDAEDVLQETYIKIYENAASYQANGKALAWILTITKNLAYMKLRKKKDTIDIEEAHDVLSKNNSHEDKIVLETAFRCLSEQERNILILHANSGFKHREIAKVLKLPLSTVLSKYHRAIKKMKLMINKEDMI